MVFINLTLRQIRSVLFLDRFLLRYDGSHDYISICYYYRHYVVYYVSLYFNYFLVVYFKGVI